MDLPFFMLFRSTILLGITKKTNFLKSSVIELKKIHLLKIPVNIINSYFLFVQEILQTSCQESNTQPSQEK